MIEKEIGTTPVTPAKLAAGNVDFYMELLNILEKGARGYTAWRVAEGRVDKNKEGEDRVKASIALEDLYVARELFMSQGDRSKIEKFQEDWGNETYVFSNFINQLTPVIGIAKEKIVSRVADLSPKERIRISMQAASRLARLSSTQRLRLFDLAGYRQNEMSDIFVRTGVSALLTGGVYFTEEYVPSLFGMIEGSLNPFLGNLADPKSLLIAVTSAGVYYVSLGLRVKQVERFLRNKDKLIPSVTAAGAYFLLQKLLADSPRALRWSTVAGYFANPLELVKEGWWLTLLIPEVGPSVFTAGNVAAISMNVALYVGFEVANTGVRTFSKVKRG